MTIKKIAFGVLAGLIVILGFAYIRDINRVIDRTSTLTGLLNRTLVKFSISDDDLVRESTEERRLGKKQYVYVYRQYKVPQDIPYAEQSRDRYT